MKITKVAMDWDDDDEDKDHIEDEACLQGRWEPVEDGIESLIDNLDND
jgi:hypothetical protein